MVQAMSDEFNSPLQGRSILLVIGGGIAAYKCLDLVRRLRERGASVIPVMTAAAKQFVTPLALASLSGSTVYDELFSLTDEAQMGHIQLSRAADLVVVAPATADLIAKMATGMANDLASTLLLATDKHPVIVPAMNVRMWLHPATQANVEMLTERGVRVVGPNDGDMACGEFGPGRMAEPLEIVAALEQALNDGFADLIPLPLAQSAKAGALTGKRVVITAGPTREPIDPVRFITNRSSGKQGYAIAAAAAAAGAEVVLISGPVSVAVPQGVQIVRVETAKQMLNAVEQALPADVFIATAAVADWRMMQPAVQKMKKTESSFQTLELTKNPDILATIAQMKKGRPRIVVGFAAETENMVENAKKKLVSKQCDLVVANDVGVKTQTFGGDMNEVVIVDKTGIDVWPSLDKSQVARRLIADVAKRLAGTAS